MGTARLLVALPYMMFSLRLFFFYLSHVTVRGRLGGDVEIEVFRYSRTHI